jgi:uncharacterized protein YjbJ (UPF0337 family)
MNKDQLSGEANDLKGKVKEEWGKATNDPSTQAGGLKDQLKGKVQKAVGDTKEAFNDADKDVADETDAAARAANRKP